LGSAGSALMDPSTVGSEGLPMRPSASRRMNKPTTHTSWNVGQGQHR
jgi:hypothetical protein